MPPSATRTELGRETIAAVATAFGGGVGIVRISGPGARAIVAKLVVPWPKNPASHTLYHGHVHDPQSGERIDEVLACVMRAPRTYTGEDVGELQGHGGQLVLGRVLDAVLACGARLAQPGEFTRRAFEAGRIDLTRAEAVAELIAARSERALKAAQALAEGALAGAVDGARQRLVRALAEVEGSLEFPDEHVEAATSSQLATLLGGLAGQLSGLAAAHRPALSDRAQVVLAGRTNAGKSSLFNALLGEERALVDARPGTTRDAVEAELSLAGVTVRLVDTAGERFTAEPDALEQRGVALGRRRRADASVVALVVDGTVGFQEGDHALWRELEGTTRLIVWNKRDRAPAATGLPQGATVVETAALDGTGVGPLRAAFALALALDDPEASAPLVSRRHAGALVAAAGALERAAALLSAGEPPELAAVDARAALHHLGELTGETVEVDVLDAIFARFCIGK